MSEQQDFLSGPPQTMFTFGFVAGVAVSAIVGMFFFGGVPTGNSGIVAVPTAQPTATAPTPAATVTPLPAVTKDDWVRGDLSKAKVVLVEYSDFECPYCGAHHPNMTQLISDYGDQVAWVYRHFPLSFHPEAMPAALASECIGEQGGNDAFWKFVDVAFADQSALGTAFYEKEVQDLGLDLAKYQDCVSSDKYATAISADQSGGQSAGVTGTPATFINGQLVSGAVPYAQLQAIVDSVL